ncbi:MAG: glycine oxidase ThiO [Amphiplicatus sp.]
MSEKIVIVGGGAIGLSIAWRLSASGARVAVIDAGARLPAATAAAAGMLAPSFEKSEGLLGARLRALSVASLARWKSFAAALEAEAGMTIGYRARGVLGVALNAEEAAALKALHETQARGAEWLDGRAARRREPALTENVVAGLFAPEEGEVDARRLAAALRRAIARRGGVFVEDVVARVAAGRVEMAGGAVIEADRVVLAAGALAPAIEIEGGGAPPLFPVKGEALALASDGSLLRHVVRGAGAYLCPKADGRIIVGASERPHDATFAPSPETIEAFKGEAARLVPATARLAEAERWAGLRPGTPDKAPLLGEAAGVVYALGAYRHGVLLAPEIAAGIAALLLDGDVSPVIRAFAPNRFDDRFDDRFNH